MTTRHEKLVANQQEFRHANERFQEILGDVVGVDGRRVPFLCECAEVSCRGRVDATLDEYDDAHINRDDYFILRGHLRVTGEEIIGQRDGYDIVRKESLAL